MRNKMLTVAGLVLAVATGACTAAPEPQKPEPAANAAAAAPVVSSEDVESTVSQLEKDCVAAIEQKDTAVLESARP